MVFDGSKWGSNPPLKGVAALLTSEPYYADAFPLRRSDTLSIYYALQIAANWE